MTTTLFAKDQKTENHNFPFFYLIGPSHMHEQEEKGQRLLHVAGRQRQTEAPESSESQPAQPPPSSFATVAASGASADCSSSSGRARSISPRRPAQGALPAWGGSGGGGGGGLPPAASSRSPPFATPGAAAEAPGAQGAGQRQPPPAGQPPRFKTQVCSAFARGGLPACSFRQACSFAHPCKAVAPGSGARCASSGCLLDHLPYIPRPAAER